MIIYGIVCSGGGREGGGRGKIDCTYLESYFINIVESEGKKSEV